LIIIDCETTGLEPYRHALVSIGAVQYEDQEKEFYIEMRPADGSEISDQALEVNGYTREYLQRIETSTYDGMRQFNNWVQLTENRLPRHYLGGFNTHFDAGFINWSYEKAKMDKTGIPIFDFHYLDLYSVFVAKVGKRGQGTGLRGVCEYLGVKPESYPHNALNGARKTAQCLKILLEEF
jgi:DNA polymerase-3 subunit epsilon